MQTQTGVFVLAAMCFINLILWIVFFIKFKKLFTTDDEIQKTREQYELLIKDVNNNTLSNINLIDLKIEELNSLIEIADRRLSTIQSETNFSKNKNNVLSSSILSSSKNLKQSPKRSSGKNANYATNVIDQEAAFEVNVNVKKNRKKIQSELFDDDTQITKKRQIHTIDSQGNAYGEVPVISPKIYMSENPIQTKKAINSKIASLYNSGYSVEQIAQQLNKSTTEIQFIIDML